MTSMPFKSHHRLDGAPAAGRSPLSVIVAIIQGTGTDASNYYSTLRTTLTPGLRELDQGFKAPR